VTWIYLSPHLDDVALSCGGLIWEQVQTGQDVTIWTMCAGDPPPGPLSSFAQGLHARWQTDGQAAAQRRDEDAASAAALHAHAHHFSLPDCIYRRGLQGSALYASEEAIFQEVHSEEMQLIKWLSDEMTRRLPAAAQVVCPLTLGGHVDHRLTRAAAGMLGRPLWFYADYPYVLRSMAQLDMLEKIGWRQNFFPISQAGLQAWVAGVAAHSSQISSFWSDLRAMELGIYDYAGRPPGVRLWKEPLT
jgi:LmbE family N-acetylglucosaminyl deacetylase